MKKQIVFIVTGFLALMTLPVFVYASIKPTGFGPPAHERIKPNGEYAVYVMKDGTWLKAGSLAFDRFYRTQVLDLERFVSGREEVRIRIVERGGSAAHIDSVLLGTVPPKKVKGTRDRLALRKVSQCDFDVVDAFQKQFDFVFPTTGRDMTLRLTARVEGERVSKTPFQFPLGNLHRTMDENSEFFVYAVKRGGDSLRSFGKPFFKEYSQTGSGHPPGFTYGWVSNDDKNLYVRIDFTPDNTMDGEKDYATVYGKAEKGLKEFRVSASETRWGKPSFTYTDAVTYQHKVYDFTIPLEALGIRKGNKPDDLLLAFAAYGTAEPSTGEHDPSLAYDAQNNRSLVVYENVDEFDERDIYGQIINPDGTPSGPEFGISDTPGGQFEVSVAYDSINRRFLAVWSDSRNQATTETDIYGQLVDAEGSLMGGNFIISNADNEQRDPSVTYDSVNKRFFVVWMDYRNSATTGSDIYGQMVNADGSLIGGNFVISNANDYQYSPSVAYDDANEQFLVVWWDDRNAAITKTDIYGQRVNADGSLAGGNIVISDNAERQMSPNIAYDSVNARFLVVWTDERNLSTTYYDIYGQLVNPDGSLYNTASDANFVISDAPYHQSETSVAYDGAHQRFLALWMDERNWSAATYRDIYGQLVNADGTLSCTESSVNVAISQHPDFEYSASVANNSAEGNFLVAFVASDSTIPDIKFARAGAACPAVSGGGGCFIATAAYGSPLAAEVQALREFRDQYLLTNAAGRAFVRLYYRLSPPIALFLSRHESLRAASRMVLTPLVYGIKYPSAVWTVIILGAAILARRRFRRERMESVVR